MEVAGLGFDEDTSTVVANARAALLDLKAVLTAQQSRDSDAIGDAVFGIEAAANEVALPDHVLHPPPPGSPLPVDEDAAQRVRFCLKRRFGGACKLTFEFLVASLLSSRSVEEVQAMNPHLADAQCQELLVAIAALLLTTSRLGHVNRCIASIDTLLEGIHALVKQRLQAAWEMEAEGEGGAGVGSVARGLFPTPEMIQRSLDVTGYHAVNAKRHLDGMCDTVRRIVAAPPVSLGSGVGRDDLRNIVMLALHLCGFEERATLAALVDPTDVMVLLNMAARACYHNGVRMPALHATAASRASTSDATSTAMIHVLEHTADDVAGNLVTRRYFMNPTPAGAPAAVDTTFTYDPRFLVFEYLIGFVLRKRQVQLVNQFASAARAGASSVRQVRRRVG